MNDSSLWIFVDETGTPDFNDKNNKIFGLGFLIPFEPEVFTKEIARIKYTLWEELEDKFDLPDFFHAKDDAKPYKKRVYELLEKLKVHETTKSMFTFYYIDKGLLEKLLNKYNPDLLNFFYGNSNILLQLFYYQMLQTYIVGNFNADVNKKIDEKYNVTVPELLNLNVVLSSIFTKKIESELKRSLYKSINENAELNRFKAYFRKNETDYCCQMADYFAWSCNRKISTGEDIGYSYVNNRQLIKTKDSNYKLIVDYTDIIFEIIKEIDNKKSPPMESNFRRET
jgi:hypothetical protein